MAAYSVGMRKVRLVTELQQLEVCRRYGVEPVPVRPGMKVGIAANVHDGTKPINGLRHPPKGDTTGWYIWAGGEIPRDDPNFFAPIHVEHLKDWYPEAIKYLALPPGWRFLITADYEDVWQDPSLLKI